MTRTAIITGGSSGIGAAVATRLHSDGFNVMVAARRSDRIAALASQLGPRAASCVTDVTDPDSVAALVEATNTQFGKVDVLVNNAGIMPVSPMAMGLVDDWDRMIDVNVRGTLHGIHAVLPQMIERSDGHIVNISSVAGHTTSPATSVYSATKFGVRAISDGLRQEMTEHNVRVSVVSPGGVNTELGDSITVDAIKTALQQRLDFDFLEPSDIAEAVSWIIGQPASVCIGEVIIRPTGQAI